MFARDRSYVDHDGALFHVAGAGLCHYKRSREVDAHGLVPLLLADLFERADAEHRCVVDENMNGALFGNKRLDALPDGIGGGHIDRHDSVAVPAKSFGDATADGTSCAGYQHKAGSFAHSCSLTISVPVRTSELFSVLARIVIFAWPPLICDTSASQFSVSPM